MALKDITDKVAPVWQALKGIATGSKIISSEWNAVIENVAERTQFLRRRGVCDWDSTLSYAVGDFVQVAGVVYKALSTNANKAPSSNPTYWEKCLMVAGEIAYTNAPEANGTASAGTEGKYARGDHVHPTDTSRAPLASPALTGTPTAPTAATGTRSTQLATTAFVGAESQIAAPTGSVYTFAGSTVPTGWLKCNGALLSRTTYAALFAVIGTTYGAGDGSTTFALPDLRGEFVRGADDGRGVDAGRVFGSAQSDAVQAWTATMTLVRGQVNSTEIYSGAISVGATGGSTTGPGGAWSASVITIGPGVNSTARTAAESRPRNVAMHYIIKY